MKRIQKIVALKIISRATRCRKKKNIYIYNPIVTDLFYTVVFISATADLPIIGRKSAINPRTVFVTVRRRYAAKEDTRGR